MHRVSSILKGIYYRAQYVGKVERVKEAATKFERRISIKIRRQEKLEVAEKRNFRRGEFLERYITKILYRRKFEVKYLK